MNVEIEFENYNIKSPKMPDPFNVNLINAVGSGGGGGGNEVELTWAEYEALSEAEKMNGTNYFITDINTTKSLTSKVLLDNATPAANTDYTLLDSYNNYDYLVVEFYYSSSGVKTIRSKSLIDVKRTKSVVAYFYKDDTWWGSLILTLNNNTKISSGTLGQINSAMTASSKMRITGYIYQRVVVPNQMINYSTIETKIGTWIDGKPLYQKTIYISALTNDTSWHEVPHGISNFKKLIDMKSNCINSSDSRHYSNNGYRPNETHGICFSATTSSIFYMNNWIAASDCYVTLIYTKITD